MSFLASSCLAARAEIGTLLVAHLHFPYDPPPLPPGAFVHKTTYRMTGIPVYDFFMGASLNPRLGPLDIKMWAEIRVSWITLFLLTLGAAFKQQEEEGTISWSLLLLLAAHWLYTNAAVKGEECVLVTFDVIQEKYGWMLSFWNLCGVPFVYSFNSEFVLKNGGQVSRGAAGLLLVALLVAYYVWDTANSQRVYVRMKQLGTYRERPWWLFPQLPGRVLENPRQLKTRQGNYLLVDGWYRYARKIPYTMDAAMALIWGLSCGASHVLPYFYVTFFAGMITHRAIRDSERCAKKYGDDWGLYCRTVPYVIIPGIW